jgi:MFS family permease
LPVFLQSVHHTDAFHTGLALLPMSLTMLVVAPLSAFFSKFITPKRLIQTGLIIAVLASIVLHFSITITAKASNFIPGLVLFGLGIGLVMAQASNLTLSAVSVEEAGEASGVNNTMRQIGSTFGSAIIGAVLLTTLAGGLSSGIAKSTLLPDTTKTQLSISVTGNAANIELGGVSRKTDQSLNLNEQVELSSIVQQASTNGSRQAILFTGGFVSIGFLLSFFLPNVKDLDRTARAATASGH